MDSIEIICKSNDYMFLLSNLEKYVYIQIAKKYNKNDKTIKSDIVKATNKMNEIKSFKNMINKNKKYEPKYTPKMIITIIVDNIMNENI